MPIRLLFLTVPLAAVIGCGEPARTRFEPVSRSGNASAADNSKAATKPARAIATH